MHFTGRFQEPCESSRGPHKVLFYLRFSLINKSSLETPEESIRILSLLPNLESFAIGAGIQFTPKGNSK